MPLPHIKFLHHGATAHNNKNRQHGNCYQEDAREEIRQRPPGRATTLLRADRKKVSARFADFEESHSAKQKQDIVSEICRELTAHATVEEEIFYPADQAALKDEFTSHTSQ